MTKRIILTSGLALFAMFFGAGNIIYPLALGAKAGTHIGYVVVAFLISGIGIPFIGLFATSLYQGDYWAFFNRLGKVPAYLVITFLILIVGPFFGAPRTETVAFRTLELFLPPGLNQPYVFSAIYCLILFLLTYKHTRTVDIIGRVLSPIKLILFTTLIIAGFTGSHTILENKNSITSSLTMGLFDGYSTMDLLAAFFFCSIVSQHIILKAKESGITSQRATIKIFLLSCLLGGTILAFVYIGFMLIALCHANELQNIDTAQIIATISTLVLGQFGALFVGICVGFACLVTAVALTEVTTSFLHIHIVKKKLPRTFCLAITIITIYAMSILGFSKIMEIALPILIFLYPALIAYSIFNIIARLHQHQPTTQTLDFQT
jgi:LIVCS family branched-chain amino acid:cation transporter